MRDPMWNQRLGEIPKPHPFSNESTGDDEGGVDGGSAHDYLVETFEKASAAPSSSWIHWDLLQRRFFAPNFVIVITW